MIVVVPVISVLFLSLLVFSNASRGAADVWLQGSEAWDGSPILSPSQPYITVAEVRLQAGEVKNWHYHYGASVGHIISGVLEITTEDGDIKIFKAGDSFIETSKLHRSRCLEDLVLIAVYVGAVGMNVSEYVDLKQDAK